MNLSNSKLSKFKPIIIIAILVLFAFMIRAQAYDINGVDDNSKSFYTHDEYNIPYFSEMDSYYNYRLTDNYLKTGQLGDTIKDGQQWDTHSYAPEGRSAEYTPLIVYITAFFYKVFNLFGKMPLMEVAFWVGPIVASLTAIPVYLFGRRISNNYGGISAALLVSLAPNLLGHSYAGFFDTDMFVLLLACMAIWFFSESILNEDKRNRIIFAVLTVLTLFVFSKAWVGYIFFFGIITLVSIIYVITAFYMNLETLDSIKKYETKKDWFLNQKGLLSISIILLLGFIVLGISMGFTGFFDSVGGLIGATNLQSTAGIGGFPNVYTTVGELQVPKFSSTEAAGILQLFLSNTGTVINGVGGILVFLSSLSTIFLLFKKLTSSNIKNKVNKENKKVSKGQRESISQRQLRQAKAMNKKSFYDDIELGTKKEVLFYLILFSLWILLSLYSVTRGNRFILILVLPVGLTAGIFIGLMKEYLSKDLLGKYTKYTATFLLSFLSVFFLGLYILNTIFLIILALIVAIVLTLFVKYSSKTNVKGSILAILLLLVIVAPTVSGANYSTYEVSPGTDDGMWHTMDWINKNTDENAIISSWWDFGHMFIVASNRSVTFDGGSQSGIRAHYVGKAFTTDNETLSAGIFTMLSNGGDKGVETLNNYTNDVPKTNKILDETLGVKRDVAKTIMTKNYGLSSSQADNVLKYTHPKNPRQNIVITSSDMVGKSPVWTGFGNWNFDTQEIEEADKYAYYTPIQEINTGKPNSIAYIVAGYNKTANLGTMITAEGNNTNATLITVTPEENPRITSEIKPYKLIIINDGYMVKDEVVDNNGIYSLFVFIEKGQVMTITMQKELGESMFTRMFLLEGYNLTSFKKVHQEKGVMAWEVENNPNNSS